MRPRIVDRKAGIAEETEPPDRLRVEGQRDVGVDGIGKQEDSSRRGRAFRGVQGAERARQKHAAGEGQHKQQRRPRDDAEEPARCDPEG